MTLVVLAAAAAALGLVRLYRLAVPAAPQLLAETNRWDQARSRANRRATIGAPTEGPVLERGAGWLADQLRIRRGADLKSVEQDLAVTGSTLEAWLTRTLSLAIVAALVPLVLVAVVRSVGLGVSLAWAPVAGIGLAVLMVGLSASDLRRDARERREEFRRGLSICLDLVVMSMEAGRGHAEAIPASAGIGTGWTFTELQDAIEGARFAGMTPWEALGRLGERYGISELTELRSTLALAHEDGARIRSTLIARAETMRETRLADAQSRADKATDSMRINTVLMAIVVAVYVIVPPIMRLVTAT